MKLIKTAMLLIVLSGGYSANAQMVMKGKSAQAPVAKHSRTTVVRKHVKKKTVVKNKVVKPL